ncbi:MAG: hypothetical protein R3E01_20950 [Pirellulaceae bacterium]|nr:hypothetical protein [Planctomycetales bacterium]
MIAIKAVPQAPIGTCRIALVMTLEILAALSVLLLGGLRTAGGQSVLEQPSRLQVTMASRIGSSVLTNDTNDTSGTSAIAATDAAQQGETIQPVVHHGARCGCGNCVPCTCTCDVCREVREKEEVKKSCWKVECEKICIPGIKFPWQSCCEPRHGCRIRKVMVLDKHDYTEEECVTTWKVETVRVTTNGHGGHGHCGHGKCGHTSGCHGGCAQAEQTGDAKLVTGADEADRQSAVRLAEDMRPISQLKESEAAKPTAPAWRLGRLKQWQP